ncbi:MAG TPA: SpoIVB peptidase S55 domain-containing protein, partial [Thermoanaerobaculia bacterium]|nr:SpoIVB peptidase S55 domain-containing protein [Thermoanaerobaculia bacterium]
MKGWGLTVMKGAVPERFEVEVLGVLPNTLGRSRILVKVSGLGLERTGVIAGMSGSPVYLDGKLAGAVSATWAFGKDPVGQVTPIENMLEGGSGGASPDAPRARATVSSAAAFDALASAHGLPPDERVAALEKIAAPYRPAAGREAASLLAPVSAGLPSATLSRFAEDLGRLGLPAPFLASAGGAAESGGAPEAGAAPGRLVNGGALTAFLLDGDLRLGATGTVTRVEADGSFVAFGHPFLGMGEIELPVAATDVVEVFASSMMSFKLAAPHAAAFRLTRDRDPGVSGRMDRVAPMIPVRFRLEAGGAAKELRWSVAPAPALFPLLLAMSTDVALVLNDPTPAQKTIALRVSIGTAAGAFVYEDILSGPRAREIAILTAIALGGLVSDNEFEDPKISGVEISLANAPGERRFRVVNAGVSARRVAPGHRAGQRLGEAPLLD